MAVYERILHTADDLLALDETRDRHVILIDGEIIEMPPPGDIHGLVAAWLIYLLMQFVEANDLGDVTSSETGFVLSPDRRTALAPDAAFIAKANFRPLTGKHFPIPPDLAVEIVSPSESADMVQKKVRKYLQCGVPLIWVVYPESKTINVHTPSGSRMLGIGDELDGGAVLPGFKVTVQDVFKKLREESNDQS